uniref:Rho-GAP domain-containing protein n=1 Tax=Heterorhabditis bacteriophora TaxID=37862 RepID=A0A1I7WG04_HETBA
MFARKGKPSDVMASVRHFKSSCFFMFNYFFQVTPDLDRVFQCLLPYFPLRSGDNTEVVLQEYCQIAGTVQWSDMSKTASPIPGTPIPNAKERAQMLQVAEDCGEALDTADPVVIARSC